MVILRILLLHCWPEMLDFNVIYRLDWDVRFCRYMCVFDLRYANVRNACSQCVSLIQVENSMSSLYEPGHACHLYLARAPSIFAPPAKFYVSPGE